MKLERTWVEDLIFGDEPSRRFTQDSPVLPDVWLNYAEKPDDQLDLLLTPHRDVSSGDLSKVLEKHLNAERKTQHWKKLHIGKRKPALIAYNQSTIVAKLWFDELVRVVLPLSNWWDRYIEKPIKTDLAEFLKGLSQSKDLKQLFLTALKTSTTSEITPEIIWMIRLIGSLEAARRVVLKDESSEATDNTYRDKENIKKRLMKWEEIQKNPQLIVKASASLVEGIVKDPTLGPQVWTVNRNRPSIAAIKYSVPTVKADAACRLFNLSCKDITWAIIDTGIDATHPAFRLRDEKTGKLHKEPFKKVNGIWRNQTRIKATFDFNFIRNLLSSDPSAHEGLPEPLKDYLKTDPGLSRELRRRLSRGKDIDWSLLLPYMGIPHEGDKYDRPGHDHGTHVAGILAADWPKDEPSNPTGIDIKGVCPDIDLYDLRVLDKLGRGNEFSVMTALQFVRYLNANKDYIVLHGVNLSLAIRHDVANFACGRTPVCEECERLIGAGVIVVAAAGNQGYLQYMTARGLEEGYRSISITDPGNTEDVITVGATHRYHPHTYGVSYFSSRGPTGDGRVKPDLVAPGEKIVAPVPGNDMKRMDGTSMAAPHVSGAAALLIARHRELAGQPDRVKQILCQTATDLGRERYFQGYGLVDILRALQSV
jgi:serine protease AprX